ncbi:hypothetical protein BSG1_11581 [Bacillus sp. SG-1]|nr:hypothetical protein BSG1_11581 [Bacillus sp. SG-1]
MLVFMTVYENTLFEGIAAKIVDFRPRYPPSRGWNRMAYFQEIAHHMPLIEKYNQKS